jgi:hypothetical protein
MDEFKSSLDNLFVLFQINSNSSNLSRKKNDDDLINDYLKKLDTLIRENYSLREKTPDRFFEFVYKIFQRELFLNKQNKLKDVNSHETNWIEMNLIINCLKNTAAAQKSHLNQNEESIIEYLIDYLMTNRDDICQMEEIVLSFHLNIFKYISNIILGNYHIDYVCYHENNAFFHFII